VDGPDHGGIDPLGPLYTVTFDAAGESVSPPALTVHHGSPLAFLPANPTRTGNDFGGWYTKPNGGGTKFEAETPVTAPITVYAWWTATVTFEGNGGIPAKQTRTVTSGSLLDPLPEEPTREEHEFDHWNTLPDGKGQAFTRQILVTAHIPVYAKWLIDPYRVTFDAAGGSVSPQSQAVARGNSLNDSHLLPTPEKEKNTFDGWYTAEKGGGEKFTADTPVTADIIIYAKWLATVTFNTDGGSAAPDPVTVTSGTTLGSKMPSNPTRTGHTFGGWYTEKDGGDPFIASTEVTADITVYARWIINQYTVTFNAAGGSPDTQTVTVNYNTPLGALLPVPTKDGYTFGGWYTAANGSGDPFIAATPVTADRTVYAKWTINTYTVIFNADGGTPATQTRQVNHDSQIGALPVPTRNDWDTFGGWYTGQDGGGTEFTEDTKVTANLTVYAKWNTSLQAFLDWVKSNAEAGGNYTYTLHANETIKSNTLNYGGKRAGITIQGDSAERTVTLQGDSDFFQLYSGITLTLGNNLTLKGQKPAPHSVIHVGLGGTLVMNAGSKICGNGASSLPLGAGVYVNGGGTFTMNGGTITDNVAKKGGGVFVDRGGTFNQNGGIITGNTGGDVVYN
jgi:uncharacterized repeat protein (TIGR02543 family)